ncbi:MAG: diheme cytochrome c [Desulfarculaceae bacterium]|nr:diheme cytochrome c [Desulfarculaceae bacterium]
MKMRLAMLACLALLLAPLAATGDDDDHGRKKERHRERNRYSEHQVPPVSNPLYREQCGACHFAFQPALLPAASWQKIVAGLDDHFGEQPDLSPGERAEILAYLEANAADRQGNKISRKIMKSLGGQAPLRVSRTPYMLHKHEDDDIPAGAFQRKAVGSRANCLACHPTAEQGVYDEHLVRIPR